MIANYDDGFIMRALAELPGMRLVISALTEDELATLAACMAERIVVIAPHSTSAVVTAMAAGIALRDLRYRFVAREDLSGTEDRIARSAGEYASTSDPLDVLRFGDFQFGENEFPYAEDVLEFAAMAGSKALVESHSVSGLWTALSRSNQVAFEIPTYTYTQAAGSTMTGVATANFNLSWNTILGAAAAGRGVISYSSRFSVWLRTKMGILGDIWETLEAARTGGAPNLTSVSINYNAMPAGTTLSAFPDRVENALAHVRHKMERLLTALATTPAVVMLVNRAARANALPFVYPQDLQEATVLAQNAVIVIQQFVLPRFRAPASFVALVNSIVSDQQWLLDTAEEFLVSNNNASDGADA